MGSRHEDADIFGGGLIIQPPTAVVISIRLLTLSKQYDSNLSSICQGYFSDFYFQMLSL